MENLRTLKLALLIVLVVFFITPAVSSAYSLSPLTVQASSTLTVSDGVTIKLKNKELNVYGTLNIAGTDTNPVTLTSAYDDTDGNDALNDGVSEGRIEGIQGVYMKAGSTSNINNAIFKFMKTATHYTDSAVSLEDVTYDSNDLGVYASLSETITKAINITFNNNTATSSRAL